MRILIRTNLEDVNHFRQDERPDGRVGRVLDRFYEGQAVHVPDFQGAALIKLGHAEQISEDWEPPTSEPIIDPSTDFPVTPKGTKPNPPHRTSKP